MPNDASQQISLNILSLEQCEQIGRLVNLGHFKYLRLEIFGDFKGLSVTRWDNLKWLLRLKYDPIGLTSTPFQGLSVTKLDYF